MKKIWLVLLMICLIGCNIGFLIWAEKAEDAKNVAYCKALPTGEAVAVAMINGEPFYLEHCREFMDMCLFLDGDTTIHQQVVYVTERAAVAEKAKKDGVTVSDEEVWDVLNEEIAWLRQSKTDEYTVKFYRMLDLLGVDEETCYQMFFEVYRNELIESEYAAQLADEREQEAFEKWEKRRARGVEEAFVSPDRYRYWRDTREKIVWDADIVYLEGFR